MNKDYRMMGYAIGCEEGYENVLQTAGGLPMRESIIGRYYGLIKVYEFTNEASEAIEKSTWATSIYALYLDLERSILKLSKMED